MYRLLFVLYIEARPELGYIPMKSDAYRLGYSLETLRDIELVKLNSEESKNGYYIDESINLLFSLIYNGISGEQQELKFQKGVGQKLFEIPSLKTHLFDSERTPILNKVKFRNTILQRVIELMSLSRQGGRNSRRGRISYAQLGINQLGAVYEALLSYQGFFAETDIYEVKKAGESYDELKNAYFVRAEDLDKYTDDEKVYNSEGTLKKYGKGTFIYRLAGRDREKSASYYTPEVLTKCLVKYALKELLKDKTADDILKLTVCEPAMGSAAFLNEAINQLAEAYLERKQSELGERIAHDEYAYERQKVKMYIADNNVFGVDLNPVAVELAEVSLWLNTISKENFVPWFGMQLVCGNSLIGARRQVFKKTLLKKENRADSLWLDKVPERVIPNEKRNADTVYHFLLPDKGMSDYRDSVVKQLAGEDIKKINNWRKSFTKEFSKSEIKTLQKFSDMIDKLWSRHTEQQRNMRRRTTDVIPVWGQFQSAMAKDSTGMRWKDKVFEQELLSKKVRNSSPYRRLKLAMDYWCSLWFWPIEKADLLPSRDEYFLDLSLILEGNPVEVTHGDGKQGLLFPTTMPKQMQLKFVNELGIVDVDKLCSEVDRFALVNELSEKYSFLHWELEFADLFEDKGGFDLVLGNPPWIEVHWEEKITLSEIDPLVGVRNISASKVANLRKDLLKDTRRLEMYLNNFTQMTGCKQYLTADINYRLLRGKNNLYKCFILQSWGLIQTKGAVGFITYEGIYSDPQSGKMREECYRRQMFHFHFQNELSLFRDVGHAKKFEINIFSAPQNKINFDMICNVFHPITIDQSYSRMGSRRVPGIKNLTEWEIQGHKERVIPIGLHELALFAKLYEESDVDVKESRLPVIHAKSTLIALNKFQEQQLKLKDIKNKYYKTTCWNEVLAEQNGIIKRKTTFPVDLKSFIYSGPHFYVANPYAKTPRQNCQSKGDYDPILLNNMHEKYIPRSNYSPKLDRKVFVKKIPIVSWADEQEFSNFYRLIFRAMIGPHAEKTLICAIIPPGPTHVNSGLSYVFESFEDLVIFGALCSSLPYDSFVKIIGKQNLHDIPLQLPFIFKHKDLIIPRFLRLNCLTIYYECLWENMWRKAYKSQEWCVKDDRLSKWEGLSSQWNNDVPLRNYFERRQSLLEIDVLVAMALNLSLNDLLTLYQIHCPVYKQYEEDTYYDTNGEIIFTCNRGIPGVGFSRSEWNEIKGMKEGMVEREIVDNTLPGDPKERTIVYHAPFDRCDREKDYEIAWKEFERRFNDKEDNV